MNLFQLKRSQPRSPSTASLLAQQGECAYAAEFIKEVAEYMGIFYQSASKATKAPFGINMRVRELKGELTGNLLPKRERRRMSYKMADAEFFALRYCHTRGGVNSTVLNLPFSLGFAHLLHCTVRTALLQNQHGQRSRPRQCPRGTPQGERGAETRIPRPGKGSHGAQGHISAVENHGLKSYR